MNEWLKKLGESAKAAWAKWSKIQKGIIIGIAIAIIIAVAALFRVSSTPRSCYRRHAVADFDAFGPRKR